ncbi:hypothetical protein N665_0156s0021 [Sinapis alba]|nr:hypothetical protein N665_0156s0021 [Sinapis alba]
MSSPIRRFSSKGKAIATASDSESSDSPLIRRPRTITLGGMENPRLSSGDDLAELNDNERSVVQFSLELENREASGHAPPDDNQKWEKHFPMRSSFKSVRRLILQTSPSAGFLFLIPASHQRMWTPLVGYACVYESWFNNCSLWWPLPEFLTTYCSQRKIALGQYTENGIRIMVTLTVFAAELGIKMLVCLFEDLTTPSITVKTWFFYGKMVPKYNVITGKPSKINEASFEDPSVILNGNFNSNIDLLGKWAQGGSDSFQEQVEAIMTLSHQNWPDISEARIQAALNIIIRFETPSRTHRQRMRKLNRSSLPSYADSIGTPLHGQEGSSGGGQPAKRRRASHPDEGALTASPRRSPPPKMLVEHLGDEVRSREPSPERNSSPEPSDKTEVVIATEEPTNEHPLDPLMENRLPEEEPQGDEFQEFDPATHGDEMVEYPHVVDFRYQHIEVPFVEDNEVPTSLFRQIKLKKKGMHELDELSQGSRYREMTRAGAIFFGNANLMVRDYKTKIKAHDPKLAEKNKSLKRRRRGNAELRSQCDIHEEKVGQLAENEKTRGDLLSKELEEMKAQKEVLDSRLWRLEQEKIEADSKFERPTVTGLLPKASFLNNILIELYN